MPASHVLTVIDLQTCVTTITMRYLAKCEGPLKELNQLRAPMASVLDYFVQQQKQLERYRLKYGDLPDSESNGSAVEEVDDGAGGGADDEADGADAVTEGSETEHE